MRFRRLFLFACIGALFALPVVSVAKPSPSEYEVKALILYKLLPFISWPEAHAPSLKNEVRICIVGQDPFGEHAKILEAQSTRSQKISVHKREDGQRLDDCHVLYVSKSKERELENFLKKVETLHVLTVSDIKNFISRGGAIGLFINAQSRIKFEVNLKTADTAGLKIDAQMLEVADRVIGR